MSKGQVQSTFIWLFAVIAGGAFLLIFFTVTQAQQEYIDNQIMDTSSNLLQDLIEVLASSDNTQRTIPAPPREIQFHCPADNHEFIYAESTLRNTIPPLPVFTPPKLPTRPFTATSIDINPGQDIGQAIFFTPSDYTISIRPNTHSRVKQIIEQSPFNFNESDSAPKIDFNTVSDSMNQIERLWGTVEYDDGDRVGWVGESMLLGALISNSSSLYSCSAQSTKRLLEVAFDITRVRSNLLSEEHSDCGQQYTDLSQNTDRPYYIGNVIDAITFSGEKQELEAYVARLNSLDSFVLSDIRRAGCPDI